ncbi:MAG: 2-amino-4-hydroxy-6-hydroxymethyldihydropteridine diphosphokinase [Sphingomonadaceae bacterium]|nr:2-amino-4-hydroxy-6-hydroxymethyldihydropteridine diphosphokinase [Sphingomonadaceae bacterium]
MATTSYAIGTGSNRRHGVHGAPADVVAAAIEALGAAGCRVVAVAPIVATPALGPGGRRFANSAAIVETERDPRALLALLKRIERAFGRRRGRRWGTRVLDLDILLWSGGALACRTLAIPHPGIASRAFVLAPLEQIAAGWRVPRTGRTVRHLAARLRLTGARAARIGPRSAPLGKAAGKAGS